MVSKIFQIAGTITAIIVVIVAIYGLTFAFYQPKIDSYQEHITELESKLAIAEDNIYTLNNEKTILVNQFEQQVEQFDTIETKFLELETKWNNTSTAIERLKVDKIFLETRLNQHTVITHNFEEEAVLWLDIRSAAVDVDPDLIPMIDILINDYRDLYVWIDKLPDSAIPAEEAAVLMNEAYQILWKLLQEDLRTFDAQWIKIIDRDIAELE